MSLPPFRRPIKQRHSVFIRRSESPGVEEKPTNNIEVCVRVRPLLQPYEDEIAWEIDENTNSIRSKMENMDIRSLNLSQPRSFADFSQRFTYDHIEGPNSKTKDIYNKLFKRIVDSVLQGYNGTIFMYGQTTSGKTYTMLGTQKDPGVLPHSLRTIFMEMPKMKGYTFTVSVSYLEIYNEVLNDLLVPGSTNLKIGDDPQYGVTVKGLKRQEVSSFEDAIYLMSYGEEHRKYRETNVNEHSSRSHTIYQVFVESFENTESQAKKRRFSCLNLVDLAGSERLSDNGGLTDLQAGETGHINKSLFLLTNVIKKLSDGNIAHIPYRDSKLTRILSNALGGNSLTAVVCAVSPALINYGQTLSTLRFASRAKKVKNAPTENLVEEIIDQKLKDEVRSLKEKLSQSEYQITKVNNLNEKLEGNLQNTKQEIRSLQKEMEELRCLFKENSRLHDDNNSNNTSLLDIIGDGSVAGRSMSKSRRKSHHGTIKQDLNQSAEIYFGDQIISVMEQALNSENSTVNTNMSIDCPEPVNIKEFTVACLKAKQIYLKDLKNIQRTFAISLEEISQKFLGKNYSPEVDSFIKNNVSTEFLKLDALQSRIAQAIKKISPETITEDPLEKCPSPTSEKKAYDSFLKDQPIQNWDVNSSPPSHHGQGADSDSQMKQYYDDMLSRMEKKYDEIYSLVTQNLSAEKKQRSESVFTYGPEVTKMANDENGSNYGEPERSVHNFRLTDSMALERRASEERPYSAGKTLRRFTSMFSKFTPDRDARKSVTSLTDFNYGNAYLWGSGKDGRLGTGRYTNEAVPIPIRDIKFLKIICGYYNSFGISQDNLVYGWGRNENGQLGVGNTMNAPIPLNVTSLNKMNIVDLACGWQHCLALSSEGRLFSWGCGDEGQLGHGDNFELLTPAEIKFFDNIEVQKIACGHSHSAAITSEGELYTWGHNSDCRLMNSTTKGLYIPTLTELHNVKSQFFNEEDMEIVSISMGATHMSLVMKNGKVYSAGRGNEGQLGQKLVKDHKYTISYSPDPSVDDDAEEILCSYFVEVDTFGENNKAIMTTCGEKFTLVLNDQGLVYSYGDASDGCLGIEYDEKERNIYQPRLIEKLADKKINIIAAGPRHAACISDTQELYCWGFNYYDQLEVGEIEKNYHIPKKIDRFSKVNVTAVSCGYFHTAAVVI